MAIIKKSEEITGQVQTLPVGEKKKSTPRKKKRDWTKIAEIGFSFSALIISIIAFIYNSYLISRSVELARKNNEFVERTLKKDLPAEFNVTFTPSENSEIIQMENVSRVDAKDIKLELKFYYVFSDNRVFTRKSVENALTKNEQLLKKFQTANLIRYANDIEFLLGRTRNLPIGEIEPEGRRTFDDFPPSTIDNALRISYLLGTELVARVRIDYKIKETLKQRTEYKFIWIHGQKPNQTIGRENLTREDLSTVIGGKKVIQLLQTFEEETKEVIFSEIDQSNVLN